MKRFFQILTIIPVVAMLFVIFGFSAENVEESSSTSRIIVVAVAEVIFKDFDELPEEQSRPIIDELSYYVRKIAHFSEFALLGIFTALHILAIIYNFSKIKLSSVLPASWAFCSFVAASDEIHQVFVPGRGCRITDMLIDSMGSLTGVLILLLMVITILGITQKCNLLSGGTNGIKKSS